VDCHGFHIAEGHALGNREGMAASEKSGTSLRMEKNK
jgi:hypothetical protein